MLTDVQMEGQKTDMTKPLVAFRNFAHVPNNGYCLSTDFKSISDRVTQRQVYLLLNIRICRAFLYLSPRPTFNIMLQLLQLCYRREKELVLLIRPGFHGDYSTEKYIRM